MSTVRGAFEVVDQKESGIAKVRLEIMSDPGTGPQQVGRVICSCAASDKLMLEAAH